MKRVATAPPARRFFAARTKLASRAQAALRDVYLRGYVDGARHALAPLAGISLPAPDVIRGAVARWIGEIDEIDRALVKRETLDE